MEQLEEVKLHLITNNNEDFIGNSKTAFNEITDSLESIGIIFTYEFDENIHDRSLLMDNGWKIVLGRGLDTSQKTNGWYGIAEYYQEKRLGKACEVTFLKEK
jgi:ATP-dependent Lon protease